MPKAAGAKALPRALAGDVRRFCESHADAIRAQKYAKFFTEGYDAWGVDHKNPAWNENLSKWVEQLRAAGPSAFLDAGDLLVRTGKYEEASFAILIARELKEYHTPEAFRRIGQWFDGGIRNWGHTDVLCGEVLSPFFTNGIVTLDDIQPWRDSPHKFQRRAAAVMLIAPLDTTKDYRSLLRFLEPLMRDGDRFVQQGVGWFLREAWKRQPKTVEPFLLKHKDTAPRVIFQYATEKMSAPEKARYRKSKA